MNSSEQNTHPAPSSNSDAAIPFFARFLEDQHGAPAEAQAGPSRMTLKYPSDRDEIDGYHAS
jgi:hypothetical protein